MDKLSPAKQPISHSSVENGAVSTATTATTATTALPVLSTRPANPPAPLMPTSSGNAQQHGNFNALKKAVRAGDMERVMQLLKQHPDCLEIADDNGKTLIFHAIAMRLPEMIALLSDQKAKLEHKDQNGFTPLCYAAQLGYVAEAEKLLECGANANFDSGDLGTPALIAARFNKPDVLDLLKKHNVNIDA